MTTQRKQINNEQFFTNFETAERLAKIIEGQPWFSKVTKVVEPSAGDGAWLKAMEVHEAYDIDPKHQDVKLQDFLDPSFSVENNGSVLYVGNPPFGRMGKLAKQFIKKCAEDGDYIAFILPASFAKVTQIRQLPKSLHLVYQEDLLTETFRFEREGKVVSTIFQIWEKRDVNRVDPPKLRECDDFSFVKFTSPIKGPAAPVPAGSNIAICTHGSGAGKVFEDSFQSKNTRTHRFIKIKSNITKEELADRLRSLDFQSVFKYTVGATCISTEEIIRLYLKTFP